MATSYERSPLSELRHDLTVLRDKWLWFVLLGIALNCRGIRRPGVGRNRDVGDGGGDQRDVALAGPLMGQTIIVDVGQTAHGRQARHRRTESRLESGG